MQSVISPKAVRSDVYLLKKAFDNKELGLKLALFSDVEKYVKNKPAYHKVLLC